MVGELILFVKGFAHFVIDICPHAACPAAQGAQADQHAQGDERGNQAIFNGCRSACV